MRAHFWKWRMKGGAITLAKNYLASLVDFDPILAAELIDLTKFLALSRGNQRGHLKS